MAKFGFTKHTYEVSVLRDGRWNLDTVCPRKSEALARAEELGAKSAGVRVTAIDDDKGSEEVVFENVSGVNDAIKPVAVDTAPICAAPDDVYGFPARRTIGRVVRQYLDNQGITALELLFEPNQLNMLERMDGFFSSAMSMVASVQAKATGEKPVDRADALQKTFGRVRDFARENRKDLDAAAETVRTGGMAMLLAGRRTLPERLGGLAVYLGSAGDWGDKIKLLLAAAEKDAAKGVRGGEAQALLDGAMAEILDGAEAAKDILAGQKDTGSALMALAQLAAGRYRPPRHAGDALVGLAKALGDDGWGRTRDVLYERVARGLGGTRPLTREGSDSDRELFMHLMREVADSAGMGGGPIMAEAAVLRAKIALGKQGEDLPTDVAIEQMMFQLPSRAARMGFLLDCCRGGLWERFNTAIVTRLGNLVGQVSSIHEMVPPGITPYEMDRTIAGLNAKIEADDLPRELKDSLGAAFGGLLSGKPRPPAADASRNEEKKTMSTETERDGFSAGTVIFEEGDPGTSAFLITEGTVDICRGNHVIATVGKGEIIGELAMIDNQPRMATARASSDVQVIAISQDNLKRRIERLDKNDKVMRLIMETLVRRLRGGA